jgi:hypothetical protein
MASTSMLAVDVNKALRILTMIELPLSNPAIGCDQSSTNRCSIYARTAFYARTGSNGAYFRRIGRRFAIPKMIPLRNEAILVLKWHYHIA